MMRNLSKGTVLLGAVAVATATGLFGYAVVGAVTVDPADGMDAAAPLAVEVAELPADGAGSEARAPERRPPEANDRGDTRRSTERSAEARPGWRDGGVRERMSGRARSQIRERPQTGPDGPEATPAVAGDLLAAAVANDPFQPNRRPSSQPYLLPWERRTPVEPREEEEEEERPEAPDFRVVGSYAMGGHGAALIQIDRDDPRVLTVGESIRGYTLESVDGESATLVGAAGSLEFTVVEPATRRRRGDDDDDDRRRRRRGGEEEQQAVRFEVRGQSWEMVSGGSEQEQQAARQEYEERLQRVRQVVQTARIRLQPATPARIPPAAPEQG